MEEKGIATQLQWALDPTTQSNAQEGVEMTVTHAPPGYLKEFFQNRQVFGGYAGLNPYFAEQMVFYVRLVNRSGNKIRINPDEFVMIDDKGNQYQLLNPDYSTALAEARAPIATTTRGVLEDARPGYFGIGLPVGKFIGKPQQRFALLRMSGFQAGYLYDGVVYDGLIAFWSPHREAHRLKLLMTNIKTDFNANDWPQRVMEFVFEFTATLKSP